MEKKKFINLHFLILFLRLLFQEKKIFYDFIQTFRICFKNASLSKLFEDAWRLISLFPHKLYNLQCLSIKKDLLTMILKRFNIKKEN